MYMKSFHFGSFRSACILTCFLALAPSATTPAYAADDLPPPNGGDTAEPPPQAPLPEDGTPPVLGEEDLPEPALGQETEDSKFRVNRIDQEDEVYLPAPVTQDTVSFSPAGAPVASPSSVSADYWRSSATERPALSMQLGGAFRYYPTTLIEDRKAGVTVGADLRLLNVAQTVFLHVFAGATYFAVGDVGQGVNTFRNIRDLTYHIGPMIEVGLGRRFSLFGAFLRRSNYITAEPRPADQTQNPDVRNLENIGEPTVYKLGVGAQWDFYVIPHGSFGLRGYVEQNFGYLALTMAIEPAPRKRFNLNFESIDRR